MAKAKKDKPATASALNTYEVLSPTRFDGDDYAIGESIELSPEQAAQAVELQHLKMIAAAPPAGDQQPPQP